MNTLGKILHGFFWGSVMIIVMTFPATFMEKGAWEGYKDVSGTALMLVGVWYLWSPAWGGRE